MADRAFNLMISCPAFSFCARSLRAMRSTAAGGGAGADRAPAAPGLLLTQRSPLLCKHAGQVAFPGGAVDNTDATLIAAALREAQEEVAIPPEAVEVIGVLPPVDSVTGFQVTPVVWALFPRICTITPARTKSPRYLKCRSPKPCAFGRYHPLDIHRRGNDHRVWLSWYQHYFVWGMTAGIIRELALQIGARP